MPWIHVLPWIHVAPLQFVQSGPEWLAILLEAIIPPFALFRVLYEGGQYAFLANSTGKPGASTIIHESS
jgi:hypothetical protein